MQPSCHIPSFLRTLLTDTVWLMGVLLTFGMFYSHHLMSLKRIPVNFLVLQCLMPLFTGDEGLTEAVAAGSLCMSQWSSSTHS